MRLLARARYAVLAGAIPLALLLGFAQPSQAQSAPFFLSCSTYHNGGVDWYFTAVFQADLKIRTTHAPGMGPFYVNGTTIQPASVQAVLDRFQAYLTQKGYKFAPGSSSACDIKATEAEAQAAKHKRAYEGNPCSNCGKVVETGWKDASN